MTLFASQPAVLSLLEGLAPYARGMVERAAHRALALHASSVAPQHLLTVLLEDEEAAATRLVLFAFADPQTLAAETLAMCPGIMVVGSRRTLPFSVRGVRALEEALCEAHDDGRETVEPADVLRAAWRQLTEEQREALSALGANLEERSLQSERAGEGEPLLRYFSNDARRAMGAASRAASRGRHDAIAPAHMLIGALEVDGSPSASFGLTHGQCNAALTGRDGDPTPPRARALAPDEDLIAMLRDMPPDADTMALLKWFLERGEPELRELLRRQKITPELFARAHEGFVDPAEVPEAP